MSQLIYSILGLTIAALFSTTLTRSVNTGSQNIVSNEVLTQMLGVGQDVLEDVGRRALPFDENTDESTLPEPITYPIVHYPEELTPADAFGGCDDFALCADLDDFHGLEFSRVTNDIEYDLRIEVRYVDESNPDQEQMTQTFAKEVTVFVNSQSIYIGSDPLTVSYERVFSYDKSTEETPPSP